jgi:hypothetical protein
VTETKTYWGIKGRSTQIITGVNLAYLLLLCRRLEMLISRPVLEIGQHSCEVFGEDIGHSRQRLYNCGIQEFANRLLYIFIDSRLFRVNQVVLRQKQYLIMAEIIKGILCEHS